MKTTGVPLSSRITEDRGEKGKWDNVTHYKRFTQHAEWRPEFIIL